ncbi:ATP-binding protein [Kitasatospora sp. NPDC051914]|uniref:ATP-binding protein n=1 Tax=Kitasatospora sp. NPDC051914 TaxID=3154945 RepID=UPI00344359E7
MLVARWRSGEGSLPTTSAGVELCALAVFLGLRVVNVGQLLISLPTALRDTTSPVLFTAALCMYLAESALLAATTVRARGYLDARLGRADVAVAVAVLLAQPWYVAPRDLTGSWTAWGFACTLGSACGAAIVFPRRRGTAVAVLALTGAYLVGALPWALPSARSTVVANAFSYAGFALLTRLLAGYLRRLAGAAERARQAAAQSAAEAARLAEIDRQRTLLHDNISVLSLLARQDLPPESAEPLRHQATVLSRKVRAFIDDNDGVPLRSTSPATTGPAHRGDGGPRELIAVVRSAAEGFWELPVTFNLDLARGVALPGPTAAAVEAATATLLHNVRLHAQAHTVVVHADADRAAGEWEITVRDDGRGFDPASTALGFGLRVQVTETLARHRVRVELDSFPDDGTTVTLRGPWEEPA